jgi:hypothetical protein
MSDTSTPSTGQTPAAPAATTENKTSTSAPSSSASAKSTATPAQRAVDEALKTLPGQSAETDDVEDDGSDLSAEELKKAETAAKKSYKLKVGGKDVDVDEAELLKRAQMGMSADEKWQEAAKMRKQLDGFMSMLQKDPAKALEKLGFDVDELAERRIQQRIEEMRKSPEQLEKEKMQQELEQIRAEREQEKEDVRTREMKQLQDHFAIEIENDISSALDNNEFGFPKSPYVVKRIADTMILAMKNGYKDVKASDVLPIVRDEIRKELHDMYSSSPDEVFEQLVGKDRLNKYRRGKIKKTKSATPTGTMHDIKSTGTKEIKQTKEQEKKQKVLSKDFFRTLGTK